MKTDWIDDDGEYLDNGHRARQIKSSENRALPFSDALRAHGIGALDVDFVLFDSDGIKPRLVIEVTREDAPIYSPDRLCARIDRRRRKAKRTTSLDDKTQHIAKALHVRVILVLFTPDIADENAVVYWRYIDRRQWHTRHAIDFFHRLKKFVIA